MREIKIFKKYYWNLMESRQFDKAIVFRKWLYKYFLRKGQKTEYVFILAYDLTSLNQVTDDMLDLIFLIYQPPSWTQAIYTGFDFPFGR